MNGTRQGGTPPEICPTCDINVWLCPPDGSTRLWTSKRYDEHKAQPPPVSHLPYQVTVQGPTYFYDTGTEPWGASWNHDLQIPFGNVDAVYVTVYYPTSGSPPNITGPVTYPLYEVHVGAFTRTLAPAAARSPTATTSTSTSKRSGGGPPCRSAKAWGS